MAQKEGVYRLTRGMDQLRQPLPDANLTSVGDWLDYVQEQRDLLEEEARIRGARSGLDELNRCVARQRKLLVEAAARLPARGAVASYVEHALAEANIESVEHAFCVAVLMHQKQFPRRYLPALVRAGVRHTVSGASGVHGYRLIEAASLGYGRAPVLQELVKAAKQDLLSYSQAMLLVTYARDAAWGKPSAPARGQAAAEYDLTAELIRITSGGTVRWLRERPGSDE